MDERFHDLEARITYQEHAIDELNKTVYRQQARIDWLEAAMTDLARRVVAGESQGANSTHEVPPHY